MARKMFLCCFILIVCFSLASAQREFHAETVNWVVLKSNPGRFTSSDSLARFLYLPEMTLYEQFTVVAENRYDLTGKIENDEIYSIPYIGKPILYLTDSLAERWIEVLGSIPPSIRKAGMPIQNIIFKVWDHTKTFSFWVITLYAFDYLGQHLEMKE